MFDRVRPRGRWVRSCLTVSFGCALRMGSSGSSGYASVIAGFVLVRRRTHGCR